MRAHDAGQPEAIFQDRVMLVEIYKSIRDRPIYDAVRYAWRANLRRAKKVDYVLAVYNGEIVGAFTPTEWLSAIPANFPDFPTRGRGESAFVGTRLPQKSRPDIFANVPRLRNVETRGNSTITGAVD